MHPCGIQTFQDEIACDWLEDLFDSDPVAFLAQSLDLDDGAQLDYLACIGVLCSSEVIHAWNDQDHHPLPQALEDWLQKNQYLDLSSFTLAAIRGMRQILAPSSELMERWSDHEEWGNQFRIRIRGLLTALEDDFLRIGRSRWT